MSTGSCGSRRLTTRPPRPSSCRTCMLEGGHRDARRADQGGHVVDQPESGGGRGADHQVDAGDPERGGAAVRQGQAGGAGQPVPGSRAQPQLVTHVAGRDEGPARQRRPQLLVGGGGQGGPGPELLRAHPDHVDLPPAGLDGRAVDREHVAHPAQLPQRGDLGDAETVGLDHGEVRQDDLPEPGALARLLRSRRLHARQPAGAAPLRAVSRRPAPRRAAAAWSWPGWARRRYGQDHRRRPEGRRAAPRTEADDGRRRYPAQWAAHNAQP